MIWSVYGTDRTDHPGGDIVMSDERTKLIGGEIETLPQPVNPAFDAHAIFDNLPGELAIKPMKVGFAARHR